jgi:hypothetical protein
MKSINENESIDNGFVSVSDLKGKYRYRYRILTGRFVPTVVIMCEGKSYEISINIPLTTNEDGYKVADIKHPKFFIFGFEQQPTYCTSVFQIKSSDTNVEKKIATFTKSLIVAEDIMNLIDRFFLGSDKTIYR